MEWGCWLAASPLPCNQPSLPPSGMTWRRSPPSTTHEHTHTLIVPRRICTRCVIASTAGVPRVRTRGAERGARTLPPASAPARPLQGWTAPASCQRSTQNGCFAACINMSNSFNYGCCIAVTPCFLDVFPLLGSFSQTDAKSVCDLNSFLKIEYHFFFMSSLVYAKCPCFAFLEPKRVLRVLYTVFCKLWTLQIPKS